MSYPHTFEDEYRLHCCKAAAAVQALDAIDPSHWPDTAHERADQILLAHTHPQIAAAYRRLVDRTSWWAFS